MSDTAQSPNAQQNSDQDERLALAAAAAIQRLIAERNVLRSQAATQERELARLRRNLILIRDSYRRLTSEFVTQWQHIDSVVGSVVEEPTESAKSSTHPTEGRDAPGD